MAGVDWYLQSLLINGQNYDPPQNSEVQHVVTHFYAISNGDGVNGFITNVCNSLSGLVEYDPNNQNFSFQPPLVATLIVCNIQLNEDFESVYFSFFDDTPGNQYSYTITTGSVGHKTLVITSNAGDQAIYGDHILSSEDFHKTQFAIHPNPAKNQLFITSKNTMGNLKAKIYDIAGKLISTQNVMSKKQVSINVSQLSSGIYFLNVEDESGNTAVKKLVKQ